MVYNSNRHELFILKKMKNIVPKFLLFILYNVVNLIECLEPFLCLLKAYIFSVYVKKYLKNVTFKISYLPVQFKCSCFDITNL